MHRNFHSAIIYGSIDAVIFFDLILKFSVIRPGCNSILQRHYPNENLVIFTKFFTICVATHNFFRIFAFVMGTILQHRISQTMPLSPHAEAMLNIIVCADYFRRSNMIICERYGISFVQYNVLRILKGALPGGHPRCEIRKRLLERGTDITRLIDKLERMELVERTRDFDDKRLSLTRITQKGVDLLDEIKPYIDTFDEMLQNVITQEECLELSRLCEKIYEHEL